MIEYRAPKDIETVRVYADVDNDIIWKVFELLNIEPGDALVNSLRIESDPYRSKDYSRVSYETPKGLNEV